MALVRLHYKMPRRFRLGHYLQRESTEIFTVLRKGPCGQKGASSDLH